MERISSRVIMLSGLIGVSVVVVGGLLYRVVDAGIRTSIEHKSAKTTTATVVHTSRSILPTTPGSSASQRSYTICYTLDSLDQVEADMRGGYEAAEHHRDEALGPRCRASGSAGAAMLKRGDKLQVRYLLANDYQIEIVEIGVPGVEFRGEDVRLSGLGSVLH